MKKCGDCQQHLPFINFSKKSKSKDGYSSRCKKCHNIYVREVWYPKNKQKQIASSNRWKSKNKMRIKAKIYNLSEEELQNLFDKSNNKCNICLDSFEETLFVDHSHETGKVRGLLCRKCNMALGVINDDVQILKNMIQYLVDG